MSQPEPNFPGSPESLPVVEISPIGNLANRMIQVHGGDKAQPAAGRRAHLRHLAAGMGQNRAGAGTADRSRQRLYGRFVAVAGLQRHRRDGRRRPGAADRAEGRAAAHGIFRDPCRVQRAVRAGTTARRSGAGAAPRRDRGQRARGRSARRHQPLSAGAGELHARDRAALRAAAGVHRPARAQLLLRGAVRRVSRRDLHPDHGGAGGLPVPAPGAPHPAQHQHLRLARRVAVGGVYHLSAGQRHAEPCAHAQHRSDPGRRPPLPLLFVPAEFRPAGARGAGASPPARRHLAGDSRAARWRC